MKRALCVFAAFHDRSVPQSVNKMKLISNFKEWKFKSPPNYAELPIDENPAYDEPVAVKNAVFSKVPTEPLTGNLHLVCASPDALVDLFDLDPQVSETDEFINFVAGKYLPEGGLTVSHRYGGYQFGYWADQLGDGRAHILGEYVNSNGESWQPQLKGAGQTPYSRFGDGRAVLRSSVREMLASEATHYLGVPTTRAAALVVSDEHKVWRDKSYTGAARLERAAAVLRVCRAWYRLGSFEILDKRKEPAVLRALAEFIIQHHFPSIDSKDEDRFVKFFKEVAHTNLDMVATWQGVGFTHGVLNTDNVSVLGVTIDYGPYGFIDHYYESYVPNSSDDLGRYAFNRQPQVSAACPPFPGVGFTHGVLNTDNVSVLGVTIDYGPYGFIDHYYESYVPNSSDDLGRYAFNRQPQVSAACPPFPGVGFTHGVLNTDNVSVLGVTIDYGPYGFIDHYYESYVPNSSDDLGRYAFNRQPQVSAACPPFPGVGFTHGVLNTDNVSVLGVTIDYGPYGFIDHYYESYVPNSSDDLGRYAFNRQPQVSAACPPFPGVGFTHGVLNTDNVSVLGVTIDYGPYGFIDHYYESYVPNSSDDLGRYAFNRQPQILLWNLEKFAMALEPILSEDQKEKIKEVRGTLEEYVKNKVLKTYLLKLGLEEAQDGDSSLVEDLLSLMQETMADFTCTFRQLAEIDVHDLDNASVLESKWSLNKIREAKSWGEWVRRYRQRLVKENVSEEERRVRMCAVNPVYVPRNWMMQEAIADAEKNDFQKVRFLLELFRKPFEVNEEAEKLGYSAQPPSWSYGLKLSCSS